MSRTAKQENKTPEDNVTPDIGQETDADIGHGLDADAVQETDADQESATDSDAEKQGKTSYKIVCNRPISKTFGGVTFINGEARTEDAFTASWFRNKKGYAVTKE